MLSQAIGGLLPLAAGVALSPIPVIAVVLMLGTPLARTNGPAFAVGWILGLSAVSALIVIVTGGADDPTSASATGVNWMQVGLGVLFLALARKQWSKRPAPGEEPELPAWMASVDHFTPGRSFALGIGLSAVNPKNLALTAAAAASIAQAGLGAGDDIVAIAVFVALGSVTVAGSVLFYLIAGERAVAPLASVKEFMSHHSAVIMMVILLVFGLKLLGDGLGALGA